MSKDLDIDNGKDVDKGAGEEDIQELSPVQQEATDRGWTTKEGFKGDPEKWVDAGAFITNGELMDKISKQNSLLKNQGKAIDSFKKMQSSIEKRAIEKAKQQLLADKAEAYNAGDGEAIVQIEEQIKVADKELQDVVKEAEVVDHGAVFSEYFSNQWAPKNDWYKTNDVMEAYADKIGVELYNKDPSVDPSDIMAVVDKKMRDKFPVQFENPSRSKAGAVGGTNQSSGSGNSRGLISKLTAVEKKVGNDLIKMGVFKNLSEYAQANADTLANEQE